MSVRPLVVHKYRARRARDRYRDAERRFFDAYGRGGDRAGRALVIPIDWFARVDVAHAFHDWLTGSVRDLDVEAIERAWARAAGHGDVTVFYRNLAHFLSLL